MKEFLSSFKEINNCFQIYRLHSKYYIKFSNTQLVGKAIDTNEIFNDYENNQTTGSYNHAEGKSTKIIGSNSHAEGENTIVYGDNSHAEGYNNIINVH